MTAQLLLQILVVTATAGYRHESIPAAEEVLASLAQERGVEIAYVRTPEEMQARLGDLSGVTALFFVNTTGELPMADAVVGWVRDGGTFVGMHSASDTWHGVPAYLEMLGGEFIGHPAEIGATLVIDDRGHVATRMLPPTQELFEEFYYLGRVDLSTMRVLYSLRARPEPPRDAGYFPLGWEKRYGQGRVLYTALGHREDVWRSAWFRAHVNGILTWAVDPPAHKKRRATRH